LLCQSWTLNEAVLDWQPEYEEQRERSHQSAYNILALIAIFLSRKQAFHLIADVSLNKINKFEKNSFIFKSLMNNLFVFHLNIFKVGIIMV
jgi:hypothetical protein